MKVIIGNSSSNIKKILLNKKISDNDYKCIVETINNYPDTFKTWFENKYLYVQRIDSNEGWGHKYIGNIVKVDHSVSENMNEIQKNMNKYPKIINLYETNVSINETIPTLNDKSILIIGLIKNISKHFSNLIKTFNDLKGNIKDCKFYFITNNNNDNTVDLLKNWISEDKNIYGTFYHDISIDLNNRPSQLAKLRNICFNDSKNYFGINFDYLMIMDTDLVEPINSEKVLSCFKINQEWDIITSNTIYKNSEIYYDSFALRLLNESDNIHDNYNNFKNSYGVNFDWLNKLYVFKSWYRVKCAFGGCCIINNSCFNMDKLWDEDISYDMCEHISMCKKFKNIFVNPEFKYNTIDFFMDFKNITDSETIYMFVPRDAGFFSVFNFLIGTLSVGYKIYPYFNFNKMLELHGKIEHFAYLDNKENCWVDFFEPIEFYLNDETHKNINKINYKISIGCEAPEEFRIPAKTTELISNNSNFKQWRYNIHNTYKKFIKFSPHILNKVNEITQKFNTKVIAVHYRHPSHCCESGYKYFNDYFYKIDNILTNYPDALIFLATDTDFGIAGFTMRYGERVIYNKEVSRTTMNNILEWAFSLNENKQDNVGFINNKGFQIHHENSQKNSSNINLANEVIIDSICISKCNFFIHSTSNISLAVSYINPDIEMIYI